MSRAVWIRLVVATTGLVALWSLLRIVRTVKLVLKYIALSESCLNLMCAIIELAYNTEMVDFPEELRQHVKHAIQPILAADPSLTEEERLDWFYTSTKRRSNSTSDKTKKRTTTTTKKMNPRRSSRFRSNESSSDSLDASSRWSPQQQERACASGVAIWVHVRPRLTAETLDRLLLGSNDVITNDSSLHGTAAAAAATTQLRELLIQERTGYKDLLTGLYDMHRAGRLYLLQRDHNDHQSSRSGKNNNNDSHRRALQVLAAVSNNLHCLYWHVRENPAVCERRARWKRA